MRLNTQQIFIVNNKTNLLLFILIPMLFNALFIGFYFSGSSTLQHLISPEIPSMVADSWREFGLVEQFQNILLLTVVMLFLREFFNRKAILEKLFFAFGCIIFTFLLLEEMDYGIHLYEYFSGDRLNLEQRNWHNQKNTDGDQHVKNFKRIIDFAMFVLFIVLPLVSNTKIMQPIKHLIPSRWFIFGFIIAILASRIAHILEDYNVDIIDGLRGGLAGNISEFRETSNYYFFMLYALYLVKEKIFFKSNNN